MESRGSSALGGGGRMTSRWHITLDEVKGIGKRKKFRGTRNMREGIDLRSS